MMKSIKKNEQERLTNYAASRLIRQYIRDQISLRGQLHRISYDYAYFLSGAPEDELSNGPGHRPGSFARVGCFFKLYPGAADTGPTAAGQVKKPHAYSRPSQAPYDCRVQKPTVSIYDVPDDHRDRMADHHSGKSVHPDRRSLRQSVSPHSERSVSSRTVG